MANDDKSAWKGAVIGTLVFTLAVLVISVVFFSLIWTKLEDIEQNQKLLASEAAEAHANLANDGELQAPVGGGEQVLNINVLPEPSKVEEVVQVEPPKEEFVIKPPTKCNCCGDGGTKKCPCCDDSSPEQEESEGDPEEEDEQKGSLSVAILPDEANQEGAVWKIRALDVSAFKKHLRDVDDRFKHRIKSSLMELIIGGTEAGLNEYPFAVSLNFISDEGNGRIGLSHFCGGSVITPRWILTAAHCVDSQNPSSIMVRSSVHDLRKAEGEFTRVKRIVVHPQWNPSNIGAGNDIALLELEREIKATPISLAEDDEEDDRFYTRGAVTTAIGWGFTKSILTEDSSSPVLLEVNLPVLDFEQSGKIMILHGNKVSNSCFGDSGSASVVKDEIGTFIQIGVTSFSRGEANQFCQGPSGWSRVSKFVKWIDQILGEDSLQIFDSNWKKSTETVEHLPIGKYEILFKDLDRFEWTTPQSIVAEIKDGTRTDVSVEYQKQ